MGAGAEAKKSSQIVAKMLRQTLTAGFEKEDSMELINSTVKSFYRRDLCYYGCCDI